MKWRSETTFTPEELIGHIRKLPRDAEIRFADWGGITADVGGRTYRLDTGYRDWVRRADVGMDGKPLVPEKPGVDE